MDFVQVESVLNDLPPPFKRDDATYSNVIDAITVSLARYTTAGDAITRQLNFTTAQYGWLDLWGLLFGQPRRVNESDVTYIRRVGYTLTAGAGPPVAIANWVFAAWGLTVLIEEDFPNVGWNITFPATVTPEQAQIILNSLVQIRPAGVPFHAFLSNIGTYLDTINYLNAARVTGAYLGGLPTPLALDVADATNNSIPLFPDLLLTDPTLNPSLSVQ